MLTEPSSEDLKKGIRGIFFFIQENLDTFLHIETALCALLHCTNININALSPRIIILITHFALLWQENTNCGYPAGERITAICCKTPSVGDVEI